MKTSELECWRRNLSLKARHIVAAQPRFLNIDSIPARDLCEWLGSRFGKHCLDEWQLFEAETLRKEREVFKAAYFEQLGPRTICLNSGFVQAQTFLPAFETHA